MGGAAQAAHPLPLPIRSACLINRCATRPAVRTLHLGILAAGTAAGFVWLPMPIVLAHLLSFEST